MNGIMGYIYIDRESEINNGLFYAKWLLITVNSVLFDGNLKIIAWS